VVGARDATQLAASTAAETVTLPEAIRAALDDVSTGGWNGRGTSAP
jgi:aryl-alcohol dehydrogenase-like predicted oxidoreductase